MTTVYPISIDNSTTLPPATGGSNDYISINATIGAVIAVETTLGISPAGPYASVRTRLDILETRVGNALAAIPSNPFFIGTTGVSVFAASGVPTTTPVPGSLYLRQDGGAGAGLYSYNTDNMWHQIGNSSLLNGATVPAGGSLIAGNVLQVTGSSALSYAPVNLAGGSNYVINTLPVSNLPSLSGDVTGTITVNSVVSVHGSSIPIGGSLTTGNILQVTGSSALSYAPINLAGGSNFVINTLPVSNLPSLSGDVTGTITANSVVALQGTSVANTSPTQSVVPVYDTSGSKYSIRQLSQDDILAGFSITSFTGGSVVECGATVTNPTFHATYSSTPASASITNTDGTDSPLVLTTPFTTGTVVGSFSHAAANATVTFTLTAVSTSTKTAASNISFEVRSFGGIGSAGATSATASGTSAVLNSSLGTLASVGLHASDVGQVYGPFSPTGQKIYLILQGGSHTFKDSGGFTFSMLSPTSFSFTNQNGAVLTMFIYESTNLLSSTFTITVST